MNKKELSQVKAKKYLETIIKENTELIIVIESVSNNGMSRRMKVIANGYNITYLIADLCDLSMNDNGLLVKGCGMDMTFWLANSITTNLYGRNKPKWLTGNGGNCLEWLAV